MGNRQTTESTSTPWKLDFSDFPVLQLNTPMITAIEHPRLFDEHISPIAQTFSDLVVREPVLTSALLGDRNAAALHEATSGSRKPFTLRLYFETDSIVAAGEISNGVACCALNAWRVALLSPDQVIRKKRLERPKGEGKVTPHQFRCTRCNRFSTDGVDYVDQTDLIRRLRDEGMDELHRVSDSKCRACRAATGASLADIAQPPRPGGNHRIGSPPSAPLNPHVVVAIADAKCRSRIQCALASCGVTILPATTDSELAAHLRNTVCSAMIIDMVFGSQGGFACVQAARKTNSSLRSLVVGSSASFSGAALSMGATAFATRDVADVQLRLMLYDVVFGKT